MERLSGMTMDDVKVHYNSSAPAKVQAEAFTHGREIHIGSNGGRHLPHEAWHVVQQKQGRVKPTLQEKGVAINDDDGLEREADVMGLKALQMKKSSDHVVQFPKKGWRKRQLAKDTKTAAKPTPTTSAAPPSTSTAAKEEVKTAATTSDKKEAKAEEKKAAVEVSIKDLTAQQILKDAKYMGKARAGARIPGGPEPNLLRMKATTDKVDGKTIHFSQYIVDVEAMTFAKGTPLTEIRDQVFGGDGKFCHHVTMEGVNAHYFKSGDDYWDPGGIAEKDRERIKGLMAAKLDDERNRIIMNSIKYISNR
jgi:hypothetical protein